MSRSDTFDAALTSIVRAIAAHDTAIALRVLRASPELAIVRFAKGATRREAKAYYLADIGHYVYPGATALHVAAAAYQSAMVKKLLSMGADVGAKNRRGAEPLHAAAVGTPGSSRWNPRAQAATVAVLVKAGADPNAVDKGGVTPLHRAVRTRCAAAVKALLVHGADPRQENNNGSTPIMLATQNTGRGGSGSPAAKAQQQQILRLLTRHEAT
jgi:hypothetical protein